MRSTQKAPRHAPRGFFSSAPKRFAPRAVWPACRRLFADSGFHKPSCGFTRAGLGIPARLHRLPRPRNSEQKRRVRFPRFPALPPSRPSRRLHALAGLRRLLHALARLHRLPRLLGRQLAHPAVVGQQVVDLVLDVGHLRVDARGKSPPHGGRDLLGIEAAQRCEQRVLVRAAAVAEILLVEAVALDPQRIAAEFAQNHGAPAPVGPEAVGLEIDVQALEIPRTLVIPAARVVDEAVGVERLDLPRDAGRVELAPALVEGHPDRDARRAAEMLERLAQLRFILRASRRVGAPEQAIVRIAQVTAEKERIGAELNVATQIQASMLPCIFPAFPDRPEFDVYATMQPAKEVGGDFYDFFLVDEDHLALVIADVSGKGVPAALFMVIAKTLLKNSAQTGASPKEILEKVNNQLCENNDAEMFVTVWIGILQISTGKIVCANAGHEYPAIRHAGGCYELVKDKHGFVLAGMGGARYREYELQLKQGDGLYVYTDGVVEATNANQELYGTERMLAALNINPHAIPEEQLPAVKADIDSFVGDAPQFDDITMLGLYYRGPAGNSQ